MDHEYWKLITWHVYLEAWKILKQHWDEEPVNWEQVHQEARDLRERYPSRLCEDILLLVIEELERHREG